jgi:hypothetical protein
MAQAPARSSEVVATAPSSGGAGGALAPREDQVLVERRHTTPGWATRSGKRWRNTARWMGLAIFVVGAALLAYVFWEALYRFQGFSQPGYLNSLFNSVAGDDVASRIQAGIAVIGTEVMRVLYLLLLGYLASAIAAKGIQFFSASEAIIDEAVVAGIEEDVG